MRYNNNRIIICFSALLVVYLIYMIYTIYYEDINEVMQLRESRLEEGFKVKKEYSKKHLKDKINKLKKKKKDPYDNNINFEKYGTTDFKSELPKNKNDKLTKLITSSKKKKKKENFNDTLSLLKDIDDDANPGKYDRFQNILDEVDKIDTNSFSFTSMNEALRSYNDNINNRMNYVKKKSRSNFDGTLAQGSVLIDELKKLFSYDSYF
jgi:hypothetical protein